MMIFLTDRTMSTVLAVTLALDRTILTVQLMMDDVVDEYSTGQYRQNDQQYLYLFLHKAPLVYIILHHKYLFYWLIVILSRQDSG